MQNAPNHSLVDVATLRSLNDCVELLGDELVNEAKRERIILPVAIRSASVVSTGTDVDVSTFPSVDQAGCGIMDDPNSRDWIAVLEGLRAWNCSMSFVGANVCLDLAAMRSIRCARSVVRLSRSIASNVSEPNDEKDCGADRNAVSASMWLRPSVGVKNDWEEFGCEDVNAPLSGISGSKIATAKSCLSSRVSRNRRRSFVLGA